MRRKKQLYLEVLRIIAIYFVIFNHTNERGYTYFTTLEPSVGYWLCMAVSCVCVISVPIFYAISGVTLIPKEESIADIWKKRIPRYLLVLILFSVLQYLVELEFDLGSCDWKEFFVGIYKKNIITPYWFLYAYLGFLVVLPFIRKMVKNLEEKEFLYLFFLMIFFKGFLTIGQYILSAGEVKLNSNFSISIVTTQMLFYPAMGYYLANKEEISWKQVGVLWIATIAAVGIMCFMVQYKINLTGELDENSVSAFDGTFRPLVVAAVFVLVKKCSEAVRLRGIGRKIVLSMGSCTFGIYLIEQLVRERGYGIYDKMCSVIPAFPAILLYVGLVLIISYVIVFAARCIPFVRKLV